MRLLAAAQAGEAEPFTSRAQLLGDTRGRYPKAADNIVKA